MKVSDKTAVFLCGTDFIYEIPDNYHGNTIYYSEKSIRKFRECVQSGCGIVECELTFKKWVEEPDYERMGREGIPFSRVNQEIIKSVEVEIEKLQEYLKRLEADEAKEK